MKAHDPKLGQIITGEAHRDAIHVAVLPIEAGDDLAPGQRFGILEGKAVPYLIEDLSVPAVGVVDPYLIGQVNRGQRFYGFLFPNTVTGMRHAWTHPGIPDEQVEIPKPSPAKLDKVVERLREMSGQEDPFCCASEAAEFAASLLDDLTDTPDQKAQNAAHIWFGEFIIENDLYDQDIYEVGELLTIARKFLDTGERLVEDGGTKLQNIFLEDHEAREAFWKNYEILTGYKPVFEDETDYAKNPFSCSC